MSDRNPVNGKSPAGIFRRFIASALIMSVHAFPTAAFSTGSFDFQSGIEGWTAAFLSAAVRHIPDGSGALEIRGAAQEGTIIARSPRFRLQMLQVYRVTAILRGNPESSLVLACRFQIMDGNSTLGWLKLDTPGEQLPGGRRRVSGELLAPWGTVRGELCVLASGETIGGTLVIEEVKLEPLQSYTIEGVYSLDPVPQNLQSINGVRPRLFLNSRRISELKRDIEGPLASIWSSVRENADRLAKTGPPAYRSFGDGRFDGQWWQSENARSIKTLSLVWLLTGEQKYLDAALTWAMTTCDYPTWGGSWSGGKDSMAGHNLYGLAVFYDWCGNSLTETDRTRIRDTLITRGGPLFRHGAAGTVVPTRLDYSLRPWAEWRDAYLQNHLWANIGGLMFAGIALYEEFDRAGEWIAFSSDRLAMTMRYLGPDGASHEGPNYWSYGVDEILKLMYVSRDLLGIDHFASPWMRATADYRLNISLPRNAWTPNETVVEYADSRARDNRSIDHVLRILAKEYQDGHAQWLAGELIRKGIIRWETWLSLLWYDPSVKPVPPNGLPTLAHFGDMGFVTARSDWSGDESLVFFKCGPYIGKTAIENMPFCLSSGHHVHPDQNHFSVFALGQSLICDDGNQGKYTGQHNTLLVDNRGQEGDGQSIFDGTGVHARGAKPFIIKAESSPDLDHFAGDAAQAYPVDMGLTKFARHLLFLKPDILIVVDDITLDTARDLELRFHPANQATSRAGNAFFTHDKAVLRIEPLTLRGVTAISDTLIKLDRQYTVQDMAAVRLKTKANSWRNATAFSWSQSDSEPAVVKMSQKGDVWTFTANGKIVSFDFRTGTASLK